MAGPEDAVGYAYLSKTLRFTVPFTRLDAPIRFKRGFLSWRRGREVAAFGVTPEHDGISEGGKYQTISDQVAVLQQSGDPNAPAEFVTRTASRDPSDRVIVARVDSADALEATWLDVQRRMVGNVDHRLSSTDDRRFAVPNIVLDEERHFAGFEGARPIGVPTLQAQDFAEHLRLRLGENGASADAESTLRRKGGSGPRPPRPDYVFDRPFLVALIRHDAMRPYFLLWVGNDDPFVPREADR